MSFGSSLWRLQKWAFVDWRPGAGLEAAATIATRGGLRGSDAVQYAVESSYARDYLWQSGQLQQVIAFSAGDFAGVHTVDGARYKGMQADGLDLVTLVGGGPLAEDRPAGGSLPDSWARDLQLAIDHTLIAISKTRVGDPPLGEGAILPAVPLLVAVGGAALAVIGSVAAWRYFDPDLQTRAMAITAASDAYAARLATQVQTGVLPPPSPLETGAVEVVTASASDQRSDAWLVGGGIAGGIALGTVGLAALRRAM